MVFSSNIFLFLFLPLFLAAYYLAPDRLRSWVIVGGSWLFYAWWRVDFLLLFVGVTFFNWWIGLRIASAGQRTAKARRWMVFGVVADLGVLGYFKYANFGVDSLNALLGAAGSPPLELAAVLLPIGISFYTFESISYIVDVYRGDCKPTRGFVDFAAFVALFPHLIAGPVFRYKDLDEQLRSRTHTLDKFAEGSVRFMQGFIKKVFIADSIAPLADAAFALQNPTTADAWLGTLAYTAQLYFDFSGYSDMAIGLALLMGFRFTENFNQPYISQSITEFWRRWHISLSNWLRDYLYISLGGNRHGALRTDINKFLTMLLGGFWHGANWTFVLFGLIHGTGLIVEGAIRAREKAGYPGFAATIWRWSERTPVVSIVTWPLRVLLCGTAFLWRPLGKYWVGDDYDHPRLLRRVFRTVLIYHFIAFTITLFRAQSVGRTVQIWSRVGDLLVDLANFDMPSPGVSKAVILVLVFGLFMDGIPSRWFHRVGVWFRTLSPVPQGLLLAAAATAIDAMAVQGVAPFLYFAF